MRAMLSILRLLNLWFLFAFYAKRHPANTLGEPSLSRGLQTSGIDRKICRGALEYRNERVLVNRARIKSSLRNSRSICNHIGTHMIPFEFVGLWKILLRAADKRRKIEQIGNCLYPDPKQPRDQDAK